MHAKGMHAQLSKHNFYLMNNLKQLHPHCKNNPATRHLQLHSNHFRLSV